mgnify:CR=1 FL=1
MTFFGNFISGQWVPSESGAKLENRNPANTSDLIGLFADSTTSDAERAICAELAPALRAEGLAPRLAPAGGVNRGNALAYARAGADLLVSSAPYFAPPAEVQVRIDPVDAA